jgi:trans-2-enoyl-CoA reductase
MHRNKIQRKAREMSKTEYEELVRTLGEQVWRMWRQQLRQEQERHTHRQRRSR